MDLSSTEQPSATDMYDSYYDTAEFLCEMDSITQIQTFLHVYVHSLICALGLVGNVLVIVTYAFYKKAKSMTDMYLQNVAVADILFVVALPLIIYNEQYSWYMGNWACKALRGIYSINLYSGMLLLACISSDRYIAIVQARRSFRIRSRTLLYSKVICACIWLLAAALSIPTLLYNKKFQMVNPVTNESSAHCYYKFEHNITARHMKILVPSTQIAVGFFVPLVVMCFCYSSIIGTLIRAKNFQKHKALRVVLAVVVVFIACHLPYNITLLTHTVDLFKEKDCEEEKATAMALIMTESLAYTHCCLNPVLYAFIGQKFRNHFRKLFEDLWCLGKRYIYSRSYRSTTEIYLPNRRSIDGSYNDNGSSFTM